MGTHPATGASWSRETKLFIRLKQEKRVKYRLSVGSVVTASC